VRAVLYEGREPFLASLYLGVASLPLVLLAFRSTRSQRTWVAGGFAFFLLMSLGRYFLPAQFLLGVPPLSLFRYPSKYLLPAALFWALLAALGAEAWRRAWSGRDRAYAWGVAGGAAALALALAVAAHRFAVAPGSWLDAFEVPDTFRHWMAVLASRKLYAAAAWLGALSAALSLRAWRPEWTSVSCLVAALAAAADVSTAARPVNTVAPAALLAHRPPLLDALPPPEAEARLLSVGGPANRLNDDVVRGPAGWEPEWRAALGAQEMIAAPLGTRWGLRGSYDPDFTGLAPPDLLFMSRLVHYVDSGPLRARLLRMGNVEWVIEGGPQGFAPFPEVARSASVFTDPLRLLRVPDPLPPAYVVAGLSRAATNEDAMRRISSPLFDPAREVVLAGEGDAAAPPASFRADARYRLRLANHLRIETESSHAAVLVVVEAFDPDWRVTIDGAPTTLERANVLFRGVRVPPGRHLVELRYFPRPVAWGLGMGAAGLLLAAAGLLRPRSR
jgi:hypothetical protein